MFWCRGFWDCLEFRDIRLYLVKGASGAERQVASDASQPEKHSLSRDLGLMCPKP